MKKFQFTAHVLPHLIAITIFFIVTAIFFKPVFFESKVLQQHDIQQFQGTAKSIQDYRDETGKEALWADGLFSGMPAYLVSVKWDNGPITFLKGVLGLGTPHPINNIFLAFICYYVMLLAFRVRPWLAIGGALAFGLSSYVIIGIGAGHNARIGAIAFMPLVMAGIHLAFTNYRLLGLGVMSAGLALHLRDNHLQMTYYLFMIVAIYGIVRLVEAIRNKTIAGFGKTIGVLAIGAAIAIGTFFGQFWAIKEYTDYSIRGESPLAGATPQQNADVSQGISKEYAFEYSNGILEPFTLLVPNFYGGGTMNSALEDRKSETFKVLQNLANKGEQQSLNQLYPYTVTYWGPQFNTAPYYGGAIIVFLFAVGIAFAERRYVWWLVSASVLSVILSWGDSFPSFNYLMFDLLPGYNKFRSVTFTLIIILFSLPLLGMLGLEKLLATPMDKSAKKKLLIAFASTGGLCLLLVIFAGVFSFTKESEIDLPDWFVDALIDDRKSMFRSDAFRSFSFITGIFIVLYFEVHRKISPVALYAFLVLMIAIDLIVVDKRYFNEEAFKRKSDRTFFAPTEADAQILKDKSIFRVYSLSPQSPAAFMSDAKPSYFHKSIGGYHGAKMRRYKEFIDSCFYRQLQTFISLAREGNTDFSRLGAFNMLNIKYIPYGPSAQNIILNANANGNAWFVNNIVTATSAADELEKTCSLDTRQNAVILASEFGLERISSDSSGSITLAAYTPNLLKYESKSSADGLVVFSELHYPKGWVATIDGKETPILRANYILRALQVPAGDHVIEFSFEPKAYYVGNKVTMASSWLVILLVIGSIGWTLRETFRP